jgi:NAD(P)-dependent dehydrogenase (short-subunit alcohol dehydrogenase family)
MSGPQICWTESPPPSFLLPDLRGGTALVTGVSMGIGRATAELLLENGARVVGLARVADRWTHPDLLGLSCDLSDGHAIEAAFREIAPRVEQLDYVVNVAGADPKHAIDTITLEEWDRLVALNLRAYYLVIKGALPLLRRGRGKSIVNISSINYRLGVPGRAPYSATKAGILGLTTGLGRELGREGIRVNTVSPGWVFTERQVEEYFAGPQAAKFLEYLFEHQAIPLKMQARDVANHVVFYLSEVSRASTGHNCVVDAGWLLE